MIRTKDEVLATIVSGLQEALEGARRARLDSVARTIEVALAKAEADLAAEVHYGPMATPVIISPCRSGTSLRAAIRKSHVYSINDPSLDSPVVEAMGEQFEAMTARMQSPELSVVASGPISRNGIGRQ